LAQAWRGRSVEYPLKHLLWRLEKLVLLNQFEMRMLSHLYRVWEDNQSNHLRKAWGVNRSNHLYKALEVAKSNNRTRIRQCPIGLHMEI
jgi:hypothetical protein